MLFSLVFLFMFVFFISLSLGWCFPKIVFQTFKMRPPPNTMLVGNRWIQLRAICIPLWPFHTRKRIGGVNLLNGTGGPHGFNQFVNYYFFSSCVCKFTTNIGERSCTCILILGVLILEVPYFRCMFSHGLVNFFDFEKVWCCKLNAFALHFPHVNYFYFYLSLRQSWQKYLCN